MRLRRVVLALLPCAAALALPAQSEPRNKIEFSNWWITAREDRFPNFATGNVVGDGLFKILPGAILDRDGDHVVTGYRIGVSVHDGYTGWSPTAPPFPIIQPVPSIRLYRTKLATFGGATYETIDLTQPLGPETQFVEAVFTSSDTWVIEVSITPQVIPALAQGQRAGIAVLALATPGESAAPNVPGLVLQSSYQERHFPPGQPSYSGSYNAATGQIAMFGTPGQPSATGELYLALRFRNPTLQLSGESAGGIPNDPDGFETHLGPGAYATDLATRGGGWFGIYVQAEQYDPAGGAPTHFALPFLVATSAGGPTLPFAFAPGVALRVNPAELAFAGLLIQAGFAGPLTSYTAPGVAGFDENQRGVWASLRRRLPVTPAAKGAAFWIQALIVDQAMRPAATTNAVRWTLE